MIPTKLVPHFVRNIVNVECVAGGVGQASGTTCFLTSAANYPKTCNTAIGSIEDVAYIVIGCANKAVNYHLVAR
jgi:hypothetical protein